MLKAKLASQASQPTNCLIRAGGGGSRAQLKVVSSIVVQWDESATSVVRANRAPRALQKNGLPSTSWRGRARSAERPLGSSRTWRVYIFTIIKQTSRRSANGAACYDYLLISQLLAGAWLAKL